MSQSPIDYSESLRPDDMLDNELNYELANEVSAGDEEPYDDDIWESEDLEPVGHDIQPMDSVSDFHVKDFSEKKYSPYTDEIASAQLTGPSESAFGSASSLGTVESPVTMQSATLLWDPSVKEVDDILHNEDFYDGRDLNIFTLRGFVNILTLILLSCGLLMLFIGYPILSAVEVEKQRKKN